MKLTVRILTLLIGICAGVAAQDKPRIECPSITVTGPAGIVPPGEIITYTVTVQNSEKFDLRYSWSVNGGKIESGQGTSVIEVRRTFPIGSAPVATVEIEGLPQQCVSTATETACELLPPQPEKLDQFAWPPNSTVGDRFRKIAEAADSDRNSQLYIFTPPDPKIRSSIADKLYAAIPGRNVDRQRMTFIETSGRISLVQIWLVPPGAKPPEKCEECEESNDKSSSQECPLITVTGPTGVIRPGDTMTFSVNGPANFKVSYKWTVSAGTIETGPGTRTITVRTPLIDTNITATVELVGLPAECLNLASKTAPVFVGGSPLILDVYGRASMAEEKARLVKVAIELNKRPGTIAVFVLRVPRKSAPVTFDSRARTITNVLRTRRITVHVHRWRE